MSGIFRSLFGVSVVVLFVWCGILILCIVTFQSLTSGGVDTGFWLLDV